MTLPDPPAQEPEPETYTNAPVVKSAVRGLVALAGVVVLALAGLAALGLYLQGSACERWTATYEEKLRGLSEGHGYNLNDDTVQEVAIDQTNIARGSIPEGCAYPNAKPVASPSPSEAPVSNPNPCGHETFDENACAVRIVMGASQQSGTSPSTTISIMCNAYDTPAKQRELIRKWMAQGAYREEARAVLDQILSYCSEGVS